MGSGAGSVQPRYHIQRVGDQYELRSVGRLRSWAVRLMRGEYAASKESLGRLELMANKLHSNNPKEAERLRGLVRSLTGMLDKCPQDQKDEVQRTLDAVRKLFPQNEGEPVSPEDAIHPQTKEEKVAIAKSIIERARSGKPAAHWPQAFLKGDPSPLTECFKEYLSQPGLTKQELAQTIEAIFKNANDSWEALINALRSKTGGNAPLEPKQTIQQAAVLFANRILPQCVAALKDPGTKDFGSHLQTIRKVADLIIIYARADATCLQEALSVGESIIRKVVSPGIDFSMTCSLPPRQFLDSVSTDVKEVQQWAATSPSKAIKDTYGRNAAIGIGGDRVPKGVQGDEKDYELVGVYHFNQALKTYLEQEGIANAQEVANQLMLRCVIESTSTDVFSSIGRYLPQPLALSEVLDVESKPVIQPDQASVRFSVEDGKCIIERDFLMQCTPSSGQSRQYAWCVSRIVVDPNDLGDHWTETVSAKPYAEALGEEARRRVTKDKTRDMAIAEVEAAVRNQLKGLPGVDDLVAQIRDEA